MEALSIRENYIETEWNEQDLVSTLFLAYQFFKETFADWGASAWPQMSLDSFIDRYRESYDGRLEFAVNHFDLSRRGPSMSYVPKIMVDQGVKYVLWRRLEPRIVLLPSVIKDKVRATTLAVLHETVSDELVEQVRVRHIPGQLTVILPEVEYSWGSRLVNDKPDDFLTTEVLSGMVELL
jgi:hypothetical protein